MKDAVRNAKRNRIKNISFYHADAGKFMVQMAARKEHADVVFLDRPGAAAMKNFSALW